LGKIEGNEFSDEYNGKIKGVSFYCRDKKTFLFKKK